MEKFQISEEQKNKIKLYTAASLPDRPGERGMRASEVKSYFYKFINVLIDAINAELLNVQSGVLSDIGDHDNDISSHSNILNYIYDLVERDNKLGNAIEEQLNAHNYTEDESVHPYLRNLIDECSRGASDELHGHDDSEYAHGWLFDGLRELINEVNELARDAYNLASGKSAVHPYVSVWEFVEAVDNDEGFNVGDIIIFKDTNVPDLTVFEKEQGAKPSGDVLLSYDTVLEEKKSYYLNGYTFVALESGIDTSKLVSSDEMQVVFGGLDARIKELIEYDKQLSGLIRENSAKIDIKEDAHKRVSSTASAIELTSYTEYSFGLITSLAISLPAAVPSDFEAIVNFRCGAQAATFDSPSEILFQGDDCLDGMLYPISNRIYELNIKRVLGTLIAKVGACDYEVIE